MKYIYCTFFIIAGAWQPLVKVYFYCMKNSSMNILLNIFQSYIIYNIQVNERSGGTSVFFQAI